MKISVDTGKLRGYEMPWYKFKCTKCKKVIEPFISFDDYDNHKEEKCKCGGDYKRHFEAGDVAVILDRSSGLGGI
jgi:putative FmdB family regulatory protein